MILPVNQNKWVHNRKWEIPVASSNLQFRFPDTLIALRFASEHLRKISSEIKLNTQGYCKTQFCIIKYVRVCVFSARVCDNSFPEYVGKSVSFIEILNYFEFNLSCATFSG